MYPGSISMAHPECRKEVLDEVDFIGSTEAMLNECKKSDNSEFIVITEVGMKHRMEKECPGKIFHFPESAVCDSMKKITLELVASCLEDMTGEIVLDDDVIRDAYLPVKRMTEIR